MTARLLALAPLAALSLAGAKPPPPSGCRGTLSGDAKGAFTCLALVSTPADGKAVFELVPKDPIPNVPVYKPGAFELSAAPAVRTYTLDDLGMGMASAAVEGGALYTATKTSSQRGEVTLTLRSVKPDPKRPGAWLVHGTYRARLPRVGGGQPGEVVVEATF